MEQLGTGILMWDGSERRSDRYGYVYLLSYGDCESDKHENIRFDHKLSGQHGKLVARVIETRQSKHIGDFFHGIFPRTPKVGAEIVLGTGTVDYIDENTDSGGVRTAVGLMPDDGREYQWLDMRALYDTHEQTVELCFQPDGQTARTTKKAKMPTNTTEQVASDPLSFFVMAMGMGTSGAIEHQEARGQRDFVNSESLPVRMGGARPTLESLGFKFGEHDGKDLFIQVDMPAGWKKVPTDHSMWSKLLDDKGRERAMIFYKAAFYDRDAHMSLSRRFSVGKRFDNIGRSGGVEVKDGNTVIHSIDFPPPIPDNASREEKLTRYNLEDLIQAEAVAWLKAQYPDWENPAAYWE